MKKDTVFDTEMTVVFHGWPDVVERRLTHHHSPSWTYVCIGETQQIVSLTEYVNREKFNTIKALLEEILTRHDQRPLRGFNRKLYVERMTKKIIDLL